MKVSKVKVGVVGLGLAAFSHIKGYQSHPNSEVVAVCDLDEEQAKKVAEKFGIPRYYASYDEMVKDPDINAIAITTPTFLHKPMALAAAKAGKHIHVEKPFCLTLEDGQEVIEEARKQGVTLAVNETYVFMTSFVKARQLIDAGEIGKPTQIRERFSEWYTRPGAMERIHGTGAKDSTWRMDSDRAGGGGYPWLFDRAAHFFAIAEYLMNGSKVKEVYAVKADNTWLNEQQQSQGKGEKEGLQRLYSKIPTNDIPLMTWTYEDPSCQGIWIRAEALNGKYDFVNGFSLSVLGDKGMIEVLGQGGGNLEWKGEDVHLVLHRKNGETQTFRFNEGDDEIWNSQINYYSQGFINRMHEFVDSLVSGQPSRYAGEDGLRDLRSSVAAICSAKEGIPVKVAEATNERMGK
jgi:predicted dehydrogenase